MNVTGFQRGSGNNPCTQERTGSGKRGILFCALCLSLLCSTPFSAAAEGNIHIGQLRINPFFSASETYNDNIYYTSTQEIADHIAAYDPGIKLTLPLGMHRVEADYYAVIQRYSNHPGEDTTDQNASGLAEFRIGSVFKLRLSDVFTKGHEPRSSSSTGFVEVFRNNIGTVAATYQLADRSKIEFDFGKSQWGFETSTFRDRDETLGSAYLYYRFLPKTSAFVEFDRKKVAFTDPTLGLDNVVDSALLGLTWEITEKSKGTIKGGRLQKDFETPATQDFSGWTGSVDLQHAFSEYTSLTLVGQRSVNETNLPTTRFYITTGGYADFTHYLLRKVAVFARGSYGVDEYSDPVFPATIPREDKTSTVGGGLKYVVKDWLELEAAYSLRTRDSNFPVNDYRDHAYSVKLSVVL